MDGWNGSASSIDSSFSFNGSNANRVDSINHGSFSFNWFPEKDQPEPGYPEIPFRVFAKARVSGDFSGASLIIQQRRNGRIIRSFSSGSGTYEITPSGWTIVAKSGLFPEGALVGDEIAVFFWGYGKSVFYVDDFTIDVRKAF